MTVKKVTNLFFRDFLFDHLGLGWCSWGDSDREGQDSGHSGSIARDVLEERRDSRESTVTRTFTPAKFVFSDPFGFSFIKGQAEPAGCSGERIFLERDMVVSKSFIFILIFTENKNKILS